MPVKFIALDRQIAEYVLRHHSHAGDRLRAELCRETQLLGSIGTMQISEEQGTFLGILVAALQVRSAVEIGTFTGYSSLCIAQALPPDGRLLCCDTRPEWTGVAERYWTRAGIRDRVDLRLGDARDTIGKLPPSTTFDFAFIDADKPSYDAYFELLLPRLRSGAILIFDNMLARGRVLSPASKEDNAVVAMNRKLAMDPRVESVLLPAADGLMLCRKR